MKFDDFDKKMRVYETAHDYCVPPGLYLVARLDGRGFSKLTKETYDFEAPFDSRFRDYMVETVRHLMTCGFDVIYGYTESDEISLLFAPEITTFSRKTRKWNSILAGEASAAFSLKLGGLGCFDCRISELPSVDLVMDYFRWRAEDAHRNALNAHCYWLLRKEGNSARKATAFLDGKSVSFKNEFLFQHGINFNELPSWQKRGIGFYWTATEKKAVNAASGEETDVIRRQLYVDYELPIKNDYSNYIKEKIDSV